MPQITQIVLETLARFGVAAYMLVGGVVCAVAYLKLRH